VLHHPSVIVTRYWDRTDLLRLVIPVNSQRHASNVRKINRVAASLHRDSPPTGHAPQKQETPGSGIPEVSTAHHLLQQESEGRCAQSDTDH
jgi:hypothetical protein